MRSVVVGEFLSAQRGKTTPESVGLIPGPRRRVSGLRREEVATLAGISVDYYVRLEQGRERHPSTQVLGAIADALDMSDDARRHLFEIAGFGPIRSAPGGAERIDPHLLQMMDAWPDSPAQLIGRTYDVLAHNRLGGALWAPLSHSENLLLNIFLDDAAPGFFKHWRTVAVNAVAGFRLAAGAPPYSARVTAIIDELRGASSEFVDIWARNDARGKSAEVKTFLHPDVGELKLRMHAFDVRSAPGQQLVVYHPESAAAVEALRLLGTLAVSAQPTVIENRTVSGPAANR